MENTKIQKIKKSAGTTAKVLKVIKTIILVGMICCIVGGVFTMLIQKDELGTFSILGRPITVHGMVDIENVNVGGFEFLKVFNIDNPFILAGLNCLVAAVICLAAYIVVNVIRNAFIEIESSDTPFTKNVMNHIKVAGILVTVLICTASFGYALIVGLTFWCIYNVFDYGMELQTEADETL